MPCCSSFSAHSQREMHFGAGRDEDHLARIAGLLEAICTLGAHVRLVRVVAHLRQALAGQRQHGRPVLLAQRDFPAFRRLDCIGRTHDEQVRDHAQALHMLDRLMRRAIFAQPDAVVRHDVDRAGLLQRGQANGGAAIVGEDEECAAIGNDAAMQRHAVHRGSHAEFADAVIDIATGAVVRRERADTAGLRVVRAGQVCTAAHGFGKLTVDLRRAPSRWPCAWPPSAGRR